MNKIVMPHGDLLVAPEAAAWVGTLLNQMAAPEFAQEFTQKVNDERMDNVGFWTEFAGTRYEALRPYKVSDGVLTIPVKGMLLKGFPFAWGGIATGYEYVEAAVLRGVSDSEVREIVLDVNSPGGTVAGCFDCVDTIYEARGTKPIRAAANEAAYSAAYAIASAADDITVARTGGVGSIGVYSAHMDISAMLANEGVTITQVFKGERKADGQPFAPLSDAAKASMEARCAALHQIFVSTVARNRGMDEETVANTESATFMAHEAVENGLADAVGPLGKMSASADHSSDEDETMSKENTSVTQAEHDSAVATATAAGTEAGKAAGRAEERARIASIMDSEEAKTRPVAAQNVAMKSDMSVEDATAFLAGMPEEAKADAPNGNTETGAGFDAAMNGTGNPDLGADPNAETGASEMSVSDGIFASAGLAPASA